MSIHNSKVLARHTPCPPEQRILTFDQGTRITVRDLFGSMPVRVKYRALQGDKSTFGRDWDCLLYDLVSILVSWPRGVSVSIRENASRQTLNLRSGSHSRTWLSDGCRLLHQASFSDSPDTSDWVPIGASAPKLSIDGYVCREPVATKRVQFISLGIEPLSNESRCNVLFEEANKVFADSAFGALDTESDSDDGRKRVKMDGFTGRELKFRKGVDRWPMFFLKITATPSPTERSLDMDDILDDRQLNVALITDLLKATFYEFLKKNHCRPKTVNLSVKGKGGRNNQNQGSDRKTEEAKTRSRTVPSFASSPMEEPASKSQRLDTSSTRSESPFDGWSRIKSGQTLPTFKESLQPSSRSQSLSLRSATDLQDTRDATKMKRSRRSTAEPSQPRQPPLYDKDGKLTRKPFEDLGPQQLGHSLARGGTTQQTASGSTSSPQEPASDDPIEWINPATKLATLVDPRTGFVLPPKPLTLSKRAAYQLTQTDNPDRSSLVETSNTTSWVKDLAEKWKNPVFELTECPIPKLPDISDMLSIDVKAGGHHCDHGLPTVSLKSNQDASALGLQGRVSKNALRRAELVAQVDNKFILVKVPFNQVRDDRTEAQKSIASCLVLIDQHAADERCRVESLMKDYFTSGTTSSSSKIWEAVTEVLPKPLSFELSRQNTDVLYRSQRYFSHWGICYDVEKPGPGQSLGSKKPKSNEIGTKTRVTVRSLPPAILERCRTEPRLLTDLIRTEAWKLNDESGPTQQPRSRPVLPGDDDSSPTWVSLFHGCPQGIIELINSRSCRSSIMFNDPLTREQCAELLARLVQCAFPFQCAHGRPSMIPLVDLGEAMGQSGNGAPKERGTGFGLQFKQWKSQKR